MTTTQDKTLFVQINNEQEGPFTLQAIQQLRSEGHINAHTLYWQAGMASWVPLAALLQDASAAVPPPLPSMPPALPTVVSSAPATPVVSTHTPPVVSPTFINPDAVPTVPVVPQTLVLAPITSRLLAALIDGIILAIPFGIGEVVVPLIGGLAIYMLYAALLMASTSQATIGQKVLGLQVVDLNGQRIGNDKAFLRAVISIPSGLLLCFGYLWALFNPKQQTLHDVVAGTCVVRAASKA